MPIFIKQNNIKRKTALAFVIFLILGAVSLMFCLYEVKSTMCILTYQTEKTYGVVTDLVRVRAGRQGWYYGPEFSFTDINNNKIIIYTQTMMGLVKHYKIGEIIPVLYDKNNSQNARINTFLGLWGKVVIFAGLSALFFVFGLIYIKKYKRIKYEK